MSESEPSLRERLAELCHAQWSGWMRYMLGDCDSSICPAVRGPNAEHPQPRLQHADYLARWRRQMATPYADLSDAEKNSDRAEADRFIALIGDVARDARFVEKVREAYQQATYSHESRISPPSVWMAECIHAIEQAHRDIYNAPCKPVERTEASVPHEEPPAPLSADAAEHLEFLKQTMRRKPVKPVKE
jgi:hypothetical protein